MNNLTTVIINHAKERPQNICLIQKNKKITFKDLYDLISNFSDYIKQKGIKKGSRVLVLAPMSVELYVSLFALWSIGAIPCFMDAGFIKNGLNKNDFKNVNAIIGTTKYLLYSSINKKLRNLKIKINVKDIKTANKNEELQVEELDSNYTAILTYTSGTTGKPKIAARTHEFLNYQGEILKEIIDYEPNDVIISTMPIFTLSNINVGVTSVIAEADFRNLGKSNPMKLINQIINTKANKIMAAPGLLDVISSYCLENKILIDSMKKVYTGGGAVFIDFIKRLKKAFPNIKIGTMYGSTEAEPIAKLDVDDMTEEDVKKTENGNGILAGHIVGVDDCKIIKPNIQQISNLRYEEFEELQTDIGEIVVTGRNVLKGYVGGVGDKENKFSVNGEIYHRTGDLGTFDEKGQLWLRGRIKEPYFNIEAALHAKFNIGKTAVFKDNDKTILVLEERKIEKEKIKEALSFETIDEIKYVKKIPVDKRHSTKVDYKELKRILKMMEK